MRMTVPIVSVLFLAFAAVAAEPVLEWPGKNDGPLPRAVFFDQGDYPGLRECVRRLRQAYGDWNGLKRFVFSTWVRVPLKAGVSYPVARFSSVPGDGANVFHTMALDIVPDGDGFALRVARCASRLQRDGFRVPFPKDRANRWTHVVFAVPDLPESGTPLLTPCVLAVAGRATEGQIHNEFAVGALAGLALGGEGVGIGPTQVFREPLGGELTVEALARRPVRRATLPLPEPRAAFHWTFGVEKPEAWSWGHNLHGPPEGAPREHIGTPNGEGSSVCYFSRGDAFKYPLVVGSASTVVAVGRFAPMPGATLFSLAVGDSPDWRTHRLVLRSGPNGTIRLAADWPGAGAPIDADLADAATAFHCYAIRFDAGILSLWVDGRQVGQTRLVTFPAAVSERFPYLGETRNLSLFGFQAGKVFYDPKIVDPHFVMDDFAVYGRALSPQEIARRAVALRCVPGKRAPAAGQPSASVAVGSADVRAALPPLAPGMGLPSAEELEAAQTMMAEILAGAEPSGMEILAFVKEAASDAGRLVTLRLAEDAFVRDKAFAEALAVFQARVAAFPGSFEEAWLVTLAQTALRANAVKAPDAALRDAAAILACAQACDSSKAARETIRLANLATRHLVKAKGYGAWRQTVAKAEARLAAAAALDDLREQAKSGAPTANKNLALALIKAARWDAATLDACVRSGDAALAKAAQAEISGDTVAAGDAWWEAADACAEADPALAKALRARAVARYRQGVHTLTGLRARLIQKRIDEVD